MEVYCGLRAEMKISGGGMLEFEPESHYGLALDAAG
jgi:hypothetical protein